MEFEIKVLMTLEYTNDWFRADLNKLEGYISERIAEKNYGSSVVKYFWGFELFKFDGEFSQFYRNEIESWKYSLNGW